MKDIFMHLTEEAIADNTTPARQNFANGHRRTTYRYAKSGRRGQSGISSPLLNVLRKDKRRASREKPEMEDIFMYLTDEAGPSNTTPSLQAHAKSGIGKSPRI